MAKKTTKARSSGTSKKATPKRSRAKKKAESKRSFDTTRYKELRSALSEHQREWERAARRVPNLFHQLIFSPEEPLSDEAWSAFMSENSHKSIPVGWQQWQESEAGDSCGRFFGDQRWFETFKSMAEATNHILNESFVETLGPQNSLPEGIAFDLPYSNDHLGWVDLLYETARAATPMLHWIGRFWNVPDDWPSVEKNELQYKSWGTTDEGVKFPMHPFYVTLPHNLFRASSETIRYWLNPDQVPIIGQCLAESPIRLPHTSMYTPPSSSSKKTSFWRQAVRQAKPNKTPRFDTQDRMLYLDDVMIKRFSQPPLGEPPGNQELLVIALEDCGWEQKQDNPIAGHPDPTELDIPESQKEQAIRDFNPSKTPQKQMEQAVRDFNRLQDKELFRERDNDADANHIFRLEYGVEYVSWFLIDAEML